MNLDDLMEFVKVCKTSDVPNNGVKGFDVNGNGVLIANVGGKFYAINSVCTHAGCMLDDGDLSGEDITCPCHGSVFDVTSGKVVNGPAEEPEQKYQLKVENNEIFVEILYAGGGNRTHRGHF